MSAVKRIYLACRAAIAELGIANYFISLGILIGMTLFALLVNQDADLDQGTLRQEYMFWDPETIVSLIVVAGWIAGLIVSGTLYNRWYKEENQAVRSFSLPLSNGERFATMLLLYLVYVPLVCLTPPLLLTMAAYLVLPETVMVPAPIYLWGALAIGWTSHAITCVAWLFPSIAYGKRVAFVLIGMILLISFYISNTHGDLATEISVPYDGPYFTNTTLDPNVVGLTNQDVQTDAQSQAFIKLKHTSTDNLLTIAQIILALIMLAAAGIALSRKTT